MIVKNANFNEFDIFDLSRENRVRKNNLFVITEDFELSRFDFSGETMHFSRSIKVLPENIEVFDLFETLN